MEKLLKPTVSVLIPCRNEEPHIATVLESLLAQDFPNDQMEIIVIDGMSTDRTREIIACFFDRFPRFRLLDNPAQVVPHALNRGIRESTADIIVRMDAHSEYPNHYISSLLHWMKRTGADNVGGIWITVPADARHRSVAIALALSHPFGIGDAVFRTGATMPIEVDTVPFGCFRREIFDRIGMFDEDLVRNQDDELNARLKKNGGKIFLIPYIKIRYFARDNFKKLWRLYYQYGLFKPLVSKKLGRPTSLRQLVPPLFVTFLLTTVSTAAVTGRYLPALVGILLYTTINLVTSVCIALRACRLTLFPYLTFAFGVIHIAYGVGYLHGAVRFLLLRRRTLPSSVPISR